jgi:peptidyl-tRNA hydrolase
MLKDRTSTFYYDMITGRLYNFITMVAMVKTHFETEENQQFYLSEWRETTLQRVIASNPTKSKLECLQILFDKLQKIQQGLLTAYHTEYSL